MSAAKRLEKISCDLRPRILLEGVDINHQTDKKQTI